MKTQTNLFTLGQTFITIGARDNLHPEDIIRSLMRHARGDWGECSPEDKAANQEALESGARIMSVYHDRHSVRFWIITEADRSSTTVLLPSEY